MVLEAVAGLRADEPSTTTEQKLDRLVRDIVASAVPVGDDLVDYTAYPTAVDAAVTGLLIDVSLTRTDSIVTRSLATVALAPTAVDGRLDGSVVLSGLPVDATDGARTLHTSAMSGDVHVSPAVDVSDAGVLRVALTSDAEPPATPAPTAPAPTSTPRSAAELAAARRTYDTALKVARTKYAKARKKAKKSKRKRVAAKKAYDVRRARATTAYRAAIADVPASAAPPAASPTVTGDASTIISSDVGWALTA